MSPREDNWTAQLTIACEKVREVERRYYDEIQHEIQQQRVRYQQQQRIRGQQDSQISFFMSVMSDPAADRRVFYYAALRDTGTDASKPYSLIRPALQNAVEAVASHPALAPVLNDDGSNPDFCVNIFNVGYTPSCLSVIAGVICRAKQIGADGMAIATRELKSLLDAGLAEHSRSPDDDLMVAHHVSLFYGLRLDKPVEITGNMTAVPLEKTKAFLNREIIKTVVPQVVSEGRWQEVSAMLQPAQWSPSFLRQGEAPSESELDWGGSFFEDARTFVKLLSLSHAVPVGSSTSVVNTYMEFLPLSHAVHVVTLMEIPYCIHRTANLLLGLPHSHDSTIHTTWARSFDLLISSNDFDSAAFCRAKQAFLYLASRGPDNPVPPISRLAGVLTRQGQYADDDRILDVVIALEQMYKPGRGKTSLKLRTKAAYFLETEVKDRLRVFEDIKDFYEVRSSIIHNRTKNNKPISVEKKREALQKKQEAFKKGFHVARESVFRLLQEEAPQDWDELILGGTSVPDDI